MVYNNDLYKPCLVLESGDRHHTGYVGVSDEWYFKIMNVRSAKGYLAYESSVVKLYKLKNKYIYLYP